MKKEIESLKARYEKFCKSGIGDPFALKTEAEKLLERAKVRKVSSAVEELKEILIDLSFSTEEMKCKCHSVNCHC